MHLLFEVRVPAVIHAKRMPFDICPIETRKRGYLVQIVRERRDHLVVDTPSPEFSLWGCQTGWHSEPPPNAAGTNVVYFLETLECERWSLRMPKILGWFLPFGLMRTVSYAGVFQLDATWGSFRVINGVQHRHSDCVQLSQALSQANSSASYLNPQRGDLAMSW